jgi:hypothetical protein
MTTGPSDRCDFRSAVLPCLPRRENGGIADAGCSASRACRNRRPIHHGWLGIGGAIDRGAAILRCWRTGSLSVPDLPVADLSLPVPGLSVPGRSPGLVEIADSLEHHFVLERDRVLLPHWTISGGQRRFSSALPGRCRTIFSQLAGQRRRASRNSRQAVNTLQALHLSGNYDRIAVVAHSLGTVVAYDMLRSYYSRINDALPDTSLLGPGFDSIDNGSLDKPAAREGGRKIVAQIALAVSDAEARIAANAAEPGDDNLKAWLVTDFVTLGSPLTHALYLMCRGKKECELQKDFDRRVREREFPTCPPRKLDNDGRLTFKNPTTDKRKFHHGGQFALTRWTNLYFPVSQLLWGDAIGGEIGPLFGDRSGSNIADLPVHTNTDGEDSFFAHVLYWNLGSGAAAPHIEALKNALDLADTGAANDPLPAASRHGAAKA